MRQHTVVREIQSGPIRGIWADADQGILAFRGIPYAAPPTGKLCWRLSFRRPGIRFQQRRANRRLLGTR